VRLRELPPVIGLLDVSNAEPLADSLAQELEQVPGVGLEIAEDLFRTGRIGFVLRPGRRASWRHSVISSR
jgi:hypothetical protein